MGWGRSGRIGMIVYKLACKNDHSFEAWFKDSDASEQQLEAAQVICPVCGTTSVNKALMAPHVAKGRGVAEQPRQLTNDPEAAARSEFLKAVSQLRQHVEANCDYVGPRFSEEARRIHYGEIERRDIYGEASPDEARKLKDEGIEVYGIPWLPRHDS